MPARRRASAVFVLACSQILLGYTHLWSIRYGSVIALAVAVASFPAADTSASGSAPRTGDAAPASFETLREWLMERAVLFCPSKVWGGIEKNVLLRARFLGGLGVEVYVVLLKGFFAERFVGLDNVEVVEVASRGGDFNLFVVANYVRILRRIRPDVVFAALKKDWWLVSLASKLAEVDRVVLYLGISRRIKSPLKYFVIFRMMKSLLMVNSESLRSEMLRHPRFFSVNGQLN